MLTLNHKRTTSSLAPPIICVAKKIENKKIEGSSLNYLDDKCHQLFAKKMLVIKWQNSLTTYLNVYHKRYLIRWILSFFVDQIYLKNIIQGCHILKSIIQGCHFRPNQVQSPAVFKTAGKLFVGFQLDYKNLHQILCRQHLYIKYFQAHQIWWFVSCKGFDGTFFSIVVQQ